MFSLASVILFKGGGLPSHNAMGRKTPQKANPPQKADPPARIRDTATGNSQQVDGTHPTGMHSCSNHICVKRLKRFYDAVNSRRNSDWNIQKYFLVVFQNFLNHPIIIFNHPILHHLAVICAKSDTHKIDASDQCITSILDSNWLKID